LSDIVSDIVTSDLQKLVSSAVLHDHGCRSPIADDPDDEMRANQTRGAASVSCGFAFHAIAKCVTVQLVAIGIA
jgi:hypothetical protein